MKPALRRLFRRRQPTNESLAEGGEKPKRRFRLRLSRLKAGPVPGAVAGASSNAEGTLVDTTRAVPNHSLVLRTSTDEGTPPAAASASVEVEDQPSLATSSASAEAEDCPSLIRSQPGSEVHSSPPECASAVSSNTPGIPSILSASSDITTANFPLALFLRRSKHPSRSAGSCDGRKRRSGAQEHPVHFQGSHNLIGRDSRRARKSGQPEGIGSGTWGFVRLQR
ncbi:hypothetical protein NMY22_g6821 [Coprinellus aureogranulatus]|nr:hypothetical protein NMY22_g6821 [Coprinellus aureogranulatus]